MSLPKTMKAIECAALEGPAALRLVERPVPAPGPGQVLVRLRAASLNFPDLLMTRGLYQFKAEPPYVPGLEAAGEIAALGPGVDDPLARVGARVMVGGKGGFFAEYAVAAVPDIEPMPDAWDFATAAAARVGFVTAYHALVHRAQIKPREVLLVHGATGGMGMAAVGLGKALGAQVIATGSNDAKLEATRQAGADFVINIAEQEEWHALVKGLTDGRGANVVFDPVGGEVLAQSLRAAARAARLLIIGFTSGGPTALPSNIALIKELTIMGVRAGEAARNFPAYRQDYRREMQRLAGEGKYRPFISHRLKLEQARQAMEMMERREIAGKLVLTID